ncbi:hypothetical protein [Mycolicibacterium arenosum]|uniref:SH3b domain-containing protein n=1 Tax=Mycolicibacterium arenosum TaxID=2952157 RepID=A0ABT1M028_9MYCO|nr:hypothetical protein [Mycolicibacterium sp. CAU 1645]MCP9272503.1 hypothetical protein [Mycolicibacterium sp. CAU 1645]
MAAAALLRALRLGAAMTLAATLATGCGGADDGEPTAGPPAEATLAVVGIAYDATLSLRSAPGDEQRVVASPGPLADDLVATGRARQLDSAIWYEVTTDGVTGWADSSALAYLGATSDATARIVDELGSPPTAASMLELGRIVASAASPEPSPSSRVSVTAAPTETDPGQVVYDVLGYQDDSVAGERLRVTGTPGAVFTLTSIEATVYMSARRLGRQQASVRMTRWLSATRAVRRWCSPGRVDIDDTTS